MNKRFDKLVDAYPIILQIGQLIVLAMIVITVIFVVNQV